MAVRFQLRRDTAANWNSANPVLALGEPGVETDTLKVKIGDGVTVWTGLGYSTTTDFTELSNLPTTLSGYGITDAATSAQGALADSAVQPGDLAAIATSGSFTDLGDTPTTLSGYGITDAATSAQGALADSAVQPGDNISELTNNTGYYSAGDAMTGSLEGDVKGSVFADNSTVMVDSVNAKINLENNNTDDLTQGSVNKYFSTAQVDAYLSGGTGVDYNTGTISIGQSVGTTDSVTFANITVSGSVDGRDIAADGSKLDGVEDNADVTDATNVEAAGALMDSELTDIAAVKALDQGVATTDNVTFNSVTGDVFTNVIDSTDSSAITITPDVTMSAGVTVGNHVLPSSSSNIDLGSNSFEFRDLYLSGTAVLSGTGAIQIPTGTEAERPTPATGQLRFNTDEGTFEGYDGAEWGTIAGSGNQASFSTYRFTATQGQTTFSGADDTAATLSYTEQNLIVTLNGIVLEDGTDYTASNGTSIVLATGAALNDELNVMAFTSFTVAEFTQFPFTLFDGTSDPIALNSYNKLPFTLFDGTPDNITLTV
jgi:hypothetical protein